MLMTVGPWKTEHFLPSFLLFFSICFSLFIGSMMALGISRCNSIEEKNLKKWKTHIPHILFNNCYFFLQKMNTRNGEGHHVWILYLQLILSNFLLICENWSSCVWKKKPKIYGCSQRWKHHHYTTAVARSLWLFPPFLPRLVEDKKTPLADALAASNSPKLS